MATPWFDPVKFGTWFGAIGGIAGGIVGASYGLIAGRYAPRGRFRRIILGSAWAMVGVGIAGLGFGPVALLSGQPHGIWYPLVLSGGICAGVFGFLIPVMRRRYAQAEVRRLQVKAIRRS